MSESIFASIRTLLETHDCDFELSEHAPAETAEQAAVLRGTALAMGVKSILFKTDDTFRILAFSAARSIRSRRLRNELSVKRTRFATRRELEGMTGLLPGSMPPFGPPILPFELVVDPSVFDRERIVFTAGLRTRSIALAAADYRRVASPRVARFTDEPKPPS